MNPITWTVAYGVVGRRLLITGCTSHLPTLRRCVRGCPSRGDWSGTLLNVSSDIVKMLPSSVTPGLIPMGVGAWYGCWIVVILWLDTGLTGIQSTRVKAFSKSWVWNISRNRTYKVDWFFINRIISQIRYWQFTGARRFAGVTTINFSFQFLSCCIVVFYDLQFVFQYAISIM